MKRPSLLTPRSLVILPLLLCASAGAAGPNLAKYPLRIQVLTSNSGSRFPTVFVPNIPTIDDADSSDAALMVGSFYQQIDPKPVFYGVGRADLLAPPATQGLTFRYNGCAARIRVSMPRLPLAARWKTPGKKLEVLLPADDAPSPGHSIRIKKCTLAVTLHRNVYLRLRNGLLVQVSQQDYARKPALHEFVVGGGPTTLIPHPTAQSVPPPPLR